MTTEDDRLLRPGQTPIQNFVLPEVDEGVEQFEEESTDPNEVSEFDPRHREAFTGLLYLGYLEKDVTLFGHDFHLSTPSTREKLAAALIHKPFFNTIGAGQAWTTLMVALYLDSVDGEDLPEPLGPSVKTQVEDRYQWVIDNIKDKVIDRLFQIVVGMETEADDALTELDRVAKS